MMSSSGLRLPPEDTVPPGPLTPGDLRDRGLGFDVLWIPPHPQPKTFFPHLHQILHTKKIIHGWMIDEM